MQRPARVSSSSLDHLAILIPLYLVRLETHTPTAVPHLPSRRRLLRHSSKIHHLYFVPPQAEPIPHIRLAHFRQDTDSSPARCTCNRETRTRSGVEERTLRVTRPRGRPTPSASSGRPRTTCPSQCFAPLCGRLCSNRGGQGYVRAGSAACLHRVEDAQGGERRYRSNTRPIRTASFPPVPSARPVARSSYDDNGICTRPRTRCGHARVRLGATSHNSGDGARRSDQRHKGRSSTRVFGRLRSLITVISLRSARLQPRVFKTWRQSAQNSRPAAAFAPSKLSVCDTIFVCVWCVKLVGFLLFCTRLFSASGCVHAQFPSSPSHISRTCLVLLYGSSLCCCTPTHCLLSFLVTLPRPCTACR